MNRLYNLKIPTKELIEDKNLSYILGVIEGDGCIDKNNYSVDLGVTDKNFALTFKKSLENWSGLITKLYIYNNYSVLYHVVLHSKIVAIYLKKYHTINKIEKVVEKVKGGREFLSGMYDSEGSIGSKQIVIYNNNKQLLLLCKNLLKDLNIDSGRICVSTKKGTIMPFPRGKIGIARFNNYVLRINSRHNLIKFRDLIDFNIKRKQKKLINEINSYIYRK